MPDRSPDGPRAGGWVPPPADPTRDITLPPLPDRPAPTVPPEWAPYVPAEGAAPGFRSAEPEPRVQPEPRVEPESRVEPGPRVEPRTDVAPREPGMPLKGSASQGPYEPPTDRFAGGQVPARSATLAFQPPPPVQLLKVSVGARRRSGRWLWALAILVPLLVIVGSGIWLLVLFYGG